MEKGESLQVSSGVFGLLCRAEGEEAGNGERGRGFGKAVPIALIQEKRMIAVRFVKAEAGHRNLCVQFEFTSV